MSKIYYSNNHHKVISLLSENLSLLNYKSFLFFRDYKLRTGTLPNSLGVFHFIFSPCFICACSLSHSLSAENGV
jgi:hypothetical protein